MTTPTQLPLLSADPSGKPSPASSTRHSAHPKPSAPPPPAPPLSQKALLREITSDWWATLDPRNWKGDGPSDAEILARSAVTGDEADDWPVVSGSRMYTLVWPTLKALATPPEAVLDAVHPATRLHGQDALHTAQDMVAWHLDSLVTTGGWHLQAADSLATLGRLSRFLGRAAPTLPQLAATLLPRLRLRLEADVLEAQAHQLRTEASLRDQPPRGRRARREIETAHRHLNDLRQAHDRATALLADPERLPPLPFAEPAPSD